MHALKEILMSDTAYTLTTDYYPFGKHLPIQDAKVIGANGAAAEIYGFVSPNDLIGQLLCNTQSIEDRQQGREAWALREDGFSVPVWYYARIERPDGEVVVVRKEAVEVPMTMGLLPVRLTTLEVVREAWEEPPDLANYGIDEAAMIDKIGYTPRQAAQPDILNRLHAPDNVRILLSEHRHLLSSVETLFSWSPTSDRLRQHYTCEGCAYKWYGVLGQATPQCSNCRREVPGRMRV